MEYEIVLKEIEKLKKNRLLKTRDEFFAFEEAIENLANVDDPKIIGELCKCFDDNTEDEEVMFGIVHIIEDFQMEEALLEIAKAIPDMIKNAKGWVKIINYRILNDTLARKIYKKVLNIINTNNRKIIVDVLQEIYNEDEIRFGVYIDEVLR